MANTISNVVPQLLAQGLKTLRERAIMPRLVNRSIDSENRERGDTIDIPVPSAITARDITAANTWATNQDMSPSKVQVALDQWKEASFHLSDKDQEHVMEGVIPMEASEAVKALANAVDSYILGKYTGIYNYGGTAGTTPFATNLNAFRDARKWLNKSAADMDNRRVVLDADAEANALVLSQFLKADERGDQEGIINGMIGRKLGADWFLNQNIPTHTGGTFGDSMAASQNIEIAATGTLGTSTAIFQSSSTTTTIGGTLVVGDIFTISGDDQPYTVSAASSVAAAAGATLAVTFSPVLAATAAAAATVTILTTHQSNLLFHRDAWAFASRPLSRSEMSGGGAMFQSVADPVSGLALRLEVARQYKQTTWSYDLLYGATLVRAKLAARILG